MIVKGELPQKLAALCWRFGCNYTAIDPQGYAKVVEVARHCGLSEDANAADTSFKMGIPRLEIREVGGARLIRATDKHSMD